jgi:16S rRNA (cytosine1402-N4)-methyltransferase
MSSAHHKVTAAQLINKSSEQELIRIFKEYGEEPHARMIARAIVAQRAHEPFKTTCQLAELVEKIIPRRGARIHPATKIFQALRIAVNHELDAIGHFLRQSVQVLNDGGRLVCISFHSLEDRLVKQFLLEHKKRPGMPGFELLIDGVVQASEQECARNPASRSAKLRAGVWRIGA